MYRNSTGHVYNMSGNVQLTSKKNVAFKQESSIINTGTLLIFSSPLLTTKKFSKFLNKLSSYVHCNSFVKIKKTNWNSNKRRGIARKIKHV